MIYTKSDFDTDRNYLLSDGFIKSEKRILEEYATVIYDFVVSCESDDLIPDNNCLDVRLQLLRQNLTLLIGDSQYDTDHRGIFIYVSICHNFSELDIYNALIDGIGEAIDNMS